jgi:hypothetical protein
MGLPPSGPPVKYIDAEERKRLSRRNTRKVMREGILRPWPVCAVPECNQRRVEAHHPSYAPDMTLDVVWLCRRHHGRLHAEHRKYA